ncbi:hypothetical protein V5E97_06910 [Singulisphaera sp. Ch08]|uniref:Uncharacterized protein n=1 Tax=Singulisphaera sp. Ch08 TaxID=3120278 RepID=A0AAU7CK13_9BACT
MSVCVDSAMFPELVERQVRVEQEQAITNRLYALAEIMATRPGIPIRDGVPDEKCFNAWRNVFLGTSDAICEIAEASVNWASENRNPKED